MSVESVRRLARGAVVWANLEPTVGHEQSGRRPVLLISHGRFNLQSGTAICMPLTTQRPRAGAPFTFELPLSAPQSWVKVSQVRTLSTERLGELIEVRPKSDVERCLEQLVLICTGWADIA